MKGGTCTVWCGPHYYCSTPLHSPPLSLALCLYLSCIPPTPSRRQVKCLVEDRVFRFVPPCESVCLIRSLVVCWIRARLSFLFYQPLHLFFWSSSIHVCSAHERGTERWETASYRPPSYIYTQSRDRFVLKVVRRGYPEPVCMILKKHLQQTIYQSCDMLFAYDQAVCVCWCSADTRTCILVCNNVLSHILYQLSHRHTHSSSRLSNWIYTKAFSHLLDRIWLWEYK